MTTPDCILPCFWCFFKPEKHLGCVSYTCMHHVTSLEYKQCDLVVGHAPSYTVSNFGVNQTNGSQVTAIFVPPHPVSVAVQTLP